MAANAADLLDDCVVWHIDGETREVVATVEVEAFAE